MPLPQHLVELAARVSNWGRWGENDQRGTLNLIDADGNVNTDLGLITAAGGSTTVPGNCQP